MVDYEHSDLFKQDGVFKHIKISYDGGEITNEDLHSEQLELYESLCSENVLRFGCCESSVLKFRVANIFRSLIGKELTVTEVLNDMTAAPFQLGKYKVQSDQPAADRRYRDIVAYDAMQDIINAEVLDWYNTLLPLPDSTVTLREFRRSFVSHFGLTEKEADLVNDNMPVRRTITPSELSGRDVITAICELNGCFGHIGRDGRFCYVTLPKYTRGLYPANDLFPADNLIPRQSNTNRIDKSYYISCRYEDYLAREITKVQLRQEENDIGAIAGTDGNCYIVEDNFLVYGMGAAELATVAENLLSVITDVSYRPFSAECAGNPCFEVGDAIRLVTRYEIVESYILQRTLKGIQALRDTYEAEGEEAYSEEVNSTNRSIVQLKGKTNTLERSVEEMRSTITDTENSLQSQITQTVEAITAEVTRATGSETELSSKIEQTAEIIDLKVSKGDLSSEISLESGEVAFRGNRVIIESDNFSLSETGEVSATGKFTSNTTDESGIVYESILGDAGLRVIRDGVEIGRVTAGSALGVRGLGLSSDSIVAITGGGRVGYMLNPSGSAGGYEERNIFSGMTRFLGKVIVASADGISAGTYHIADNEIRSTTGIHLIPNNGNNNVHLRGAQTISQKEDGTWTPVFASSFSVQSARKSKENFSGIARQEAARLLDIAPLHFDYRNGSKAQSGFIAEEVEPYFPEICSYTQKGETGEKELFGLDYSKFVPYIVALLQIQAQEIMAAREDISNLKSDIAALKAAIAGGEENQ